MQALQPTQREDSINTTPSFARFCIAPVGHADTHQGVSQWKQGMKTKLTLGMPPLTLGPTRTILQNAGPTGKSLSVLQ
jgi:hypothetical protein